MYNSVHVICTEIVQYYTLYNEDILLLLVVYFYYSVYIHNIRYTININTQLYKIQ